MAEKRNPPDAHRFLNDISVFTPHRDLKAVVQKATVETLQDEKSQKWFPRIRWQLKAFLIRNLSVLQTGTE